MSNIADRALKIYREKTADFLPPMIPEAYYGFQEAPDDASVADKVKNVGKSWLGGVGGKVKGMMAGGAVGGMAGLFHPFRSKAISPSGMSWRALMDVLAYGTAGAAVGGTAGRLMGARQGAQKSPEDPSNVYDLRG